ncbi:MAG: hypothetical protein JO303_05945 [Caulobacteraceae bacterium]|nr:hypothetical protein [Caulobacteraceae bacterium]
MKHAGPAALDALAPLLEAIRARPGLTERKPGVFYRKHQAWLHFHEDPAGLFADLKVEGDWKRFDVTDAAGGVALVACLDAEIGA